MNPTDVTEPPSTCWCCGGTDDPLLMVHLGDHPEVALCRPCARWASKQAGAIDDHAARGPAVFMRNRLRDLRQGVIDRNLHRNRFVGPALRRLGDWLP